MSRPSEARELVEYAMVRVLFSFLGLLPRRLAIAFGCALGWITYHAGRSLRATGERNLLLAFPNISVAERDRILRGCFRNLGKQLGEFSHFPKLTPEILNEIVETDKLDAFWEKFKTAQAKGSGVIFVTAHLGSWELSSLGLSALGHPLSFLVRRLDNSRIENFVERIRTRFGNRSIDKRGGLRAMLKVLRAGGTLGLLMDVNMQPKEGIFVDFFGVPASTTFTVAQLALRTKATVIPVFVPWDHQHQRYILSLGTPIPIDPSDNEDEDVRRITARLTRVIEDQIRRYPDQWLWIHKRWRTRPPGEPDLYKNPRQVHTLGAPYPFQPVHQSEAPQNRER
jgi:Kdo2-lipid IVA lauroyltransferase/acyltransferase